MFQLQPNVGLADAEAATARADDGARLGIVSSWTRRVWNIRASVRGTETTASDSPLRLLGSVSQRSWTAAAPRSRRGVRFTDTKTRRPGTPRPQGVQSGLDIVGGRTRRSKDIWSATRRAEPTSTDPPLRFLWQISSRARSVCPMARCIPHLVVRYSHEAFFRILSGPGGSNCWPWSGQGSRLPLQPSLALGWVCRKMDLRLNNVLVSGGRSVRRPVPRDERILRRFGGRCGWRLQRLHSRPLGRGRGVWNRVATAFVDKGSRHWLRSGIHSSCFLPKTPTLRHIKHMQGLARPRNRRRRLTMSGRTRHQCAHGGYRAVLALCLHQGTAENWHSTFPRISNGSAHDRSRSTWRSYPGTMRHHM